MLKETADAMHFMHSQGMYYIITSSWGIWLLHPEYIHRNLKSSNLLLDKLNHVKICGIGLSRPAPTEKDCNMTNSIGSDLWSAPEVLKKEPYGKPADVFSFGMIVDDICPQSIIRL